MEHGKLRIDIEGKQIGFYPHTSIDDVYEDDTEEISLRAFLESINEALNRKTNKGGDVFAAGKTIIFSLPSDDKALLLSGGQDGAAGDHHGAKLALYGQNSTGAGAFELSAMGAGGTPSLVGSSNGDLTWNGKAVGVINSSDVNNSNGHVLLSNGLQICWDAVTITQATQLTFRRPFNGTPSCIIACTNAPVNCSASGATATNFMAYMSNYGSNGYQYRYIAIGRGADL